MKHILLYSTAALVLVPGSFSIAQDNDAKVTLEEIVVTSQRREQSLQDVPISVTAFTARVLEKANITEAKDYLTFTPNVSFSEDGESGNRSISISIRGVSNVDLGEVNVAQSIGYYIDEFNVGTVANGVINPQLQDMERIEILRGPQGTYFGRNSLGGAINITTKKPDENLYGEASVKFGRFSTWGLEGIINVPVSEKLMLRAVGAYEESNGIVKNVNPNGAPNSGYEYQTLRVSARALPTDQLTLDLSVTYTKEDEGHDASVASGVLDLDTKSIFGGAFVPIDDQLGFFPQNTDTVNHNTLEFNNNDFWIVNGRISWDGDGVSFKSVTGYIKSNSDRRFDQDNISTDTIIRNNEYSGSSFSQEFRLQSNGENDLDWIIGALYSKDKINQFNSIVAGSEGSYTDPVTGDVIGLLPPIPAGFRINENNFAFDVESYAFFGEGVYHVSEALDIAVGARFTHDKVTSSSFGVVAFEGAVPDAMGSRSFSDFSPKISLNYHVNDEVATYATVSKGYKAGGVDINRGSITDFAAENLWNYEVGFKSRLAEGRVQLNGAVYYLNWKDLQVQSNFLAIPGDISSAVQKTLNAAKASSKGFEIDLRALLSDNFELTMGAGYSDSSFDNFPEAILAGGNIANLTDLNIPNTPDWTLSAAVDYTHEISDTLEGFARAEWSSRSSTAGDLEGVAAAQLGLPSFPYVIPSFNVVNIRLGVNGDNFSISGYVENLFEENYYTGTSDNFGLGGIRIRPHPRIWGVRLTIKSGK